MISNPPAEGDLGGPPDQAPVGQTGPAQGPGLNGRLIVADPMVADSLRPETLRADLSTTALGHCHAFAPATTAALAATAATATARAADPGPKRYQTTRALSTGRPRFELIIDTSNLVPFDFLRQGDRVGRAVVKLEREDGATGTGFLVAPDILLTNHHVLPNAATALSSYALANYERTPPDDAWGRSVVAPLEPQRLFVTNSDLDFTFCGVANLEFLGVIPVDRNSLDIARHERVNIIQHPRGRPKEIALQDNEVVRADHLVVQYSCDTEPGSSGSPVFNNRWRLVAMHHASVPITAGGGDEGHGRYLNEGIRMSAIAIWLEIAEPADLTQRRWIEQLRGIFGGLDPQVGFFGALGRQVQGLATAEIIADSYLGGADDLDVAFWDLQGPRMSLRDRLPLLTRAIASMGMDLWVLTHLDPADVVVLCDELAGSHRLDYGVQAGISERGAPITILYKRDGLLSVTRPAWAAGSGAKAPPRVLVRTTSRRGETRDVHLVVFARAHDEPQAAGAQVPEPPTSPPVAEIRPWIEAILIEAERPGPDAHWLLLGCTETLLTPWKVARVTFRDRPLLPIAAEHPTDGAILVLQAARARLGHLYLSPDMTARAASNARLTVVHDRQLPALDRTLIRHAPIAMRLCFRTPPEPAPEIVEPEPGPIEPAPKTPKNETNPARRRAYTAWIDRLFSPRSAR
ncbi:serine protease [Isosphaeraceae bacterium EP7]